MERIRFTILTLLALCLSFGAYTPAAAAPEKGWRVTGTVTDEAGQPLIGASILIKGTQKGVTTDAQGRYAIDASKDATLVVMYIGYEAAEVAVGGKTTVDIRMKESANLLDEVTVTALGIKREKKALGYSIGEVKGDELEKVKEPNVINSLAGKIPGLVISQTASGPSGSTRVMIRGNTELTGNNQPLYVVDGIPLDNTNFNSADGNGGYDLGDGISSINPDDIENISVLKGPAASALYGSRASHGVILITTKKADNKKRLGIEINSTTTFEWQLTKYNDLQTTYGQGTGGRITGSDDNHSYNKSWGPKIDNGLWINYFDGVRRPYEYVENNIDGFFRTGVTTTNSVIFNTTGKNAGLRVSYTNMENRDIIPGSDMGRNTFNMRATSTIADKVDLDFKANYVRESVDNRPSMSNSITNIGKNLITLASTFNQAWLRNNYKTEAGDYYDWNNHDIYNLNPYWITREMRNESTKDRISGSGSLNYRISDKFSARLTGGGEINMFDFLDYAPRTTPGKESGQLQTQSFKNYTYNAELLLSYKDRRGKFDWGVNVGGNIFHVNNRTQVVTAKDMQMREVVALQSFAQKEIVEDVYRKQINSAFGMVNIAYDNFLFLDATLRCDHSSTLPKGNNTYVYPSVSASFLFSELIEGAKDIFPYGKLRASVAQVGSDTDPYRVALMYSMLDKSYDGFSLGQIYNAEIPNAALKPTRTNSWEVGFDLRFLNNRIGLDFTYYSQRSKDQIMRLNTSAGSGYNAKIINAGEIENRGVEIALNTRPIDRKDFTWEVNLNFSKNSNKVKALSNGMDRFTLSSAPWLGVTVDAVVGENYGAIMGYDFLRNDAGEVIIDAANGLPKRTDDARVLGNATWDWTGGLTTAFRYKSLSLRAIFDIKVGADLYSMSARSFYQTGKHKATLPGRDAWYASEEARLAAGTTEADWKATGGFVAPGVVETVNPDGSKSYAPNTQVIDPEDYWSHITTNIPSPFVYDNTYIKCREITLTYSLPQRWTQGFAEGISVSVVARNPFIVYKNIENIDPDSNYNNSTGMGLECGSLPSRRSLGFNINVKF